MQFGGGEKRKGRKKAHQKQTVQPPLTHIYSTTIDTHHTMRKRM